jgi:purine-binding chemotaxis protein CheW
MADTRQYCTFLLDQLLFGVDVRKVQEVIPYHEMTRVPLATHAVHGLINLRGQIVTAIDLRERLELGSRPAGAKPMNVVIRDEDGLISLLVDEIGEVMNADEAAFERPPETLQGKAREMIQGAHKLKDGLLLVLDSDKAMDITGASG